MRALSVLAFSLAVMLLALNVFGLLFPNDQRSQFDLDLIPYSDVFEQLDEAYKKHGESPEFFKASVKIYNQSINYVWPEELSRIPVYDNYILYAASFFDELIYKAGLTASKTTFSQFESVKYERALQRGFGICSQNALGLTDILTRRYNIKANMVGLDGHVVLTASDAKKGEWYLLDPSVGVFMPFDLQYAEQNLAEVHTFYQHTQFPVLTDKFNASGNLITKESGSGPFRPKMAVIEQAADVLKWVIPFFFVLTGFFLVRLQKR